MLHWINSIRVRDRLLILGLGVVAVFISLNIYQFRDFQHARETVDRLYWQNFTTAIAIKDTRYAVSQITDSAIALASETVLFEDGKNEILHHAQGNDVQVGIHGAWKSWNDHYQSMEFVMVHTVNGKEQTVKEKETVERLKNQVTEFTEQLKTLEAALLETDEDDFEASDISPITNQMAYLGVELEETLQLAVKLENAKINAIQDEFRVKLDADLTFVFRAMIAISIAAVLAMLWLAHSISSPLKQLQRAFSNFLETGNLNQKITIEQGDEIGELARHFNEFIDKLAGIIHNVKENSQVLLESSRHLSLAADKMGDNTQIASQQVNGISSLVTEMNMHMEQAQLGTEDVSENTTTLTSSMEKMTEAMNQINRITEQAAKISSEAMSKLETANEQIAQLENTSTQVTRIVSTIEQIADNCKMLALNAGIEAVRVGEVGKGFTVVANEVKNLSKQTSDEVGIIAAHIQSMVDATVKTREAADGVNQTIRTLTENNQTIAQSVGRHLETTHRVMQTTRSNAGYLSEVTESVEQANELFRKVADRDSRHEANIAKLLKQVESMSSEVSVVRKDAKELAELAQKLDEQVAGFQV
ncbi:methyl-accepting chemotaxis protein [Acanthopleuribacter pedis]|uniref:Methyl-accepting chemotaxis protein n=1 Tax=Acanthopleuribacter pedis TaxID=442870 RepID=A0A8J7U3H4_9BACT|nr:methyl-accepting chemotaxis protein [Acanthopleuribacter pedis]MBO1319637.1 methyl-accepting chemotaxis protein [Acanthopleuribacter pedis]